MINDVYPGLKNFFLSFFGPVGCVVDIMTRELHAPTYGGAII